MQRRILGRMLLATTSVAGVAALTSRAQTQGGFIATAQAQGTCSAPCYPQTQSEVSASITPADLSHPVGHVLRYGADPTGQTDSSKAIQNAITIAQLQNVAVTFPEGGLFSLLNSLVFQHGQSTADTQKYSVVINGNFSSLFPAPNTYAITIVPRCALADATSGRADSPIVIKDLIIDGGRASGHQAGGIMIGAPGFRWQALGFCEMTNVTVQNIMNPGAAAFRLIEGRHMDFYACVVRGFPTVGATMEIESTTSGSFCGDFSFYGCEFSGNQEVPGLSLISSGGGSVRGISFVDCAIFGAGTTLSVSGSNSQLGDIWFDSCRFDSAAGGDTFLNLNSNGQMFNVHIMHSYFVTESTSTQAIFGNCASSGQMMQIEISGCNFGNPFNEVGSPNQGVIAFTFAYGLAINGNLFSGVSGAASPASAYINLNNCTNMSVNNNLSMNPTANLPTFGVNISGKCNSYSILGNMLACTKAVVNNTGGGTVFEIANNLAINT